MQNTQMYRCSILCSLSSSLFCNNKIISLLYELVNLMTLLSVENLEAAPQPQNMSCLKNMCMYFK